MRKLTLIALLVAGCGGPVVPQEPPEVSFAEVNATWRNGPAGFAYLRAPGTDWVLCVNGGGWRSTNTAGACRDLGDELHAYGVTTVIADYTTGANSYPQNVDDVEAVYDWVYKRLGVPIGIGGQSAGATLALLVDRPSASWFGYSTPACLEDYCPGMPRRAVDVVTGGSDAAKYAFSPINHCKPNTLLVHNVNDMAVPVEQVRLMESVCAPDVTLVEVAPQGYDHAFPYLSEPVAASALFALLGVGS